jgi:hypothetical protein
VNDSLKKINRNNKMKIPSLMNSINHSTSPLPVRRGFPLIALALTWFALLPTGRAQDAAESDANGNTAMEGSGALGGLTSGSFNTGLGFAALFTNTSGSSNTATGFDALVVNKTGSANTATGASALGGNTSGNDNTASGFEALLNNTASANTAIGSAALQGNTTGVNNTAEGYQAMFKNVGGFSNTANGFAALYSNASGNSNVATGVQALYTNSAGTNNTADGFKALYNATGSNNTALGYQAGFNLTTGSNNIDIGNAGKSADANIIRIGGTQKSTFIAGIAGTGVSGAPVLVTSGGKLGVNTSSARFKDDIKPMDKASEAILALKPVTFRYKEEVDPEKMPQFGLVAEEVEKVDPELVVHDEQGKPFTVRYEAVNAMLLNEFLKEHRKVAEQQATIDHLRSDFQSKVSQQQKQIETLTAGLKTQAEHIQKVSAQLRLNKAMPQIAVESQ